MSIAGKNKQAIAYCRSQLPVAVAENKALDSLRKQMVNETKDAYDYGSHIVGNATPVKDSSGKVIGAIEIVTDQTALMTVIKNAAQTVDTLASASTELSAISQQMTTDSGETSAKSNTVASAADEMSVNTVSVASGMEQATANLNTVATATEEMTATIGEIAESGRWKVEGPELPPARRRRPARPHLVPGPSAHVRDQSL